MDARRRASGIISVPLCIPYELHGGLDRAKCTRVLPSFAMIVFAVRMLEGMFVIGMLGSVLVVVLTAFDDIRELFGRHDDEH